MAKLLFIVSLCILYLTSQETYNINKQEEIESVFQNIQAGDEIIFHEGTYQLNNNIKFSNLNGTEEKPTILKSAEEENIIFYAEDLLSLTISWCNYVYVEGPFSFTNHQIYITESANIKINNIKVTINDQHPINIGTSLNVQISNSEIFNSNDIYIIACKNINISNNKIYNSNGKGLYGTDIETINFNNNIIYGNVDNNIYLYDFKNIIFDGNYLINNSTKDNVYIENLSYEIKSVFFKNNIIIGGNNCLSIKINEVDYPYYDNITILNNIIIFPEQNAVIFPTESQRKPNGCIIKNNIFNGNFQIDHKDSWDIGYNFFYGSDTILLEDKLAKSMASNTITLDEIFFCPKVKCSYSSSTLTTQIQDLNCFRPKQDSKNSLSLYKKGIPTDEVTTDIINDERSKTSPSIGPFENYFIGILLYAQYCINGDNSLSLILLIKGDKNKLKYLEKKENCMWVCYLDDDEDIINYILTIGEDDSIYRYQSKEYKQLNISQLKESLLNDNSNNDNKIYIDTSGGNFNTIVYVTSDKNSDNIQNETSDSTNSDNLEDEDDEEIDIGDIVTPDLGV